MSAGATQAYRAGDFTTALARFQDAYALVPAPELLFNLGQCYRQLQRDEAAWAVFDAYLQARPNAPERAQIKRWLAEHDAKQTPALAVAPAAAELPVKQTAPSERAAAVDQTLIVRRASAQHGQDDRQDDGPELYERWWFWTAVGVVAVSGGITAAVLLDGDDASAAGAGSLGTVRWD